jgi:lysophospholipase L1-like esterase
MRPLLLASVAVAIAGMTMIQPAHAFTVPLPSSMASTGDSITRAYDINWFHLLSDSPQYSWSTGYNGSVTSQYEHILALNPAISGHEFNDAKTSAKMVDLDGQVKNAASQEAQYLTVLMGANDLCTSSTATMTSTATFGTQFRQALNDFFIADPTAHVYVSSLPNLYQLWSVLHTNSSARNVWSTFGICQSMLRNSNTESQRQAVVVGRARITRYCSTRASSTPIAVGTTMQATICSSRRAISARWITSTQTSTARTTSHVSPGQQATGQVEGVLMRLSVDNVVSP